MHHLAVTSLMWTAWLPTILMVGGAVMIGLVAGLAIRDYFAPTAAAREDADRLCRTKQLEQWREAEFQCARMIEPMELAISQLRDQVLHLEQNLDQLRRPAETSFRESPSKPSAPPPDELTSSAQLTSRSDVNIDIELDSASFTTRVLALADAGRTSIEIAHALKEHIGKVELVLALRKI